MASDVQTFPVPGPGEFLVLPPRETWHEVLTANLRAAGSWDFAVAGRTFLDVRREARTDALAAAASFTSRIEGLSDMRASTASAAERPIVMTGHQPEFFHPGVWVKDFLVDEFAGQVGATGLDLVVDSDAFDVLGAAAPCMQPHVHRCSGTLAVAAKDACFACAPTPPAEAVEGFCVEVDGLLATLSSPLPRENFSAFCDALRRSGRAAENLAELVTFARRVYESSAGTSYLELPVTSLGRSAAFASFVFDIALDAQRFVAAYNAELDAFRKATSTRSLAQPFPDLELRDGQCELPFWVLGSGTRATLWAESASDGCVRLRADAQDVGRFGAREVERFAAAVAGAGLAPKALTLTLFARVFLADVFIHGTGGARYDRVTDGVMRRYWGIEPPRFVVASLTERLPLEADFVAEDEVSEAIERLNRFEHNPDAMLDRARFSDRSVEARARALAAEKAEFVRAIGDPGADRKLTGLRIREINASMRELMAPLGDELKQEVERLKAARADSEILEDRTYPFFYWDPRAIADRVR